MCKEDDSQLPPRNVKGLPPPGEKVPQPDSSAVAVPMHGTKLSEKALPEGPLADQSLSEISDSSK